MTDLRILLSRTIGFISPSPARPRRFTSEQVKRYLDRQIELAEADALAIRRALESVGEIADDPRFAYRFRGFPSYVEVLPKIMFLYLLGKSPREIARALNFLATDYGVETVVDIATQVVAERLNAAC